MLALVLSSVVATSPPDEASAAFRRGRELLTKGRLADACAAFDESHRLDPALGALLNLAECTFKLEQHARAWMLYSEVLSWATRTKSEPRAVVARERLEALRPTVALAVASAPVETVVVIDRQRLVPGQTVALEPGAHVVEYVTGAETETRTITVKGGDTLTLTPTPPSPAPVRLETALEPAPAISVPEVTAAGSASPPPPARVGPVALGVSGAVLSVASAVALGWAVSIWNQGEAQRRGGPLTVTQQTYELAGTLYPVSVATLSAGLLALVGGVVWWLFLR